MLDINTAANVIQETFKCYYLLLRVATKVFCVVVRLVLSVCSVCACVYVCVCVVGGGGGACFPLAAPFEERAEEQEEEEEEAEEELGAVELGGTNRCVPEF